MIREKREELSKQTLLVERAQAEIKHVIKRGIVNGKQESEVFKAIALVISKAVGSIEDKEFATTVYISLNTYANKAYKKLKEQLRGINLLYALTSLQTKNTKPSGGGTVVKTLTSTLAPTIPIVDVDGQYYDLAQGGNEFSETYVKKVKQAFIDLATSEAKDDYSTRVSLRNVSEMAVRYEKKNQELQALVEKGIDLVWISTHGNCSERCQPWQGKLYSISGRYGTIDGIKYQPLSNATDIFYTTKAGRTYKNGCISGFGCRHKLEPYNKGNKPSEISASVIDKEREINKKQREYERKVRENKLKYVGLKDIAKDEALKYLRKSREVYKAYKEYCQKNNVAYYPSRCKVFDGEEELTQAVKRLINKRR